MPESKARLARKEPVTDQIALRPFVRGVIWILEDVGDEQAAHIAEVVARDHGIDVADDQNLVVAIDEGAG